VAVFSTVSLLSVLMWKAGLLWGHDLREHAGPVWIVVSFAVTVIAHDAYFYWAHRAMHHRRLFALFHRTHHLSRTPTLPAWERENLLSRARQQGYDTSRLIWRASDQQIVKMH